MARRGDSAAERRLSSGLAPQSGTTGSLTVIPPGATRLIIAGRRFEACRAHQNCQLRTLYRPQAELFSDEATRADLATNAEPWLLARALELSSVGEASLTALEQAVSGLARSYPSTPLRSSRPVLAHLRDVAHLLDGPPPVIRRQRLAVAGHLAGLAGSLAFDLRQESKAIAYFAVALQAAGDANSPDLRFGPCHPVDEATKAAGR